MDKEKDIEIIEALEALKDFIGKMSGTRATSQELSFALTKYFVRKEILEFIALYRKGQE